MESNPSTSAQKSEMEFLANVSHVVSQDCMEQNVIKSMEDKMKQRERAEIENKYRVKIEKLRAKINELSTGKTSRTQELKVVTLVEQLGIMESNLEKIVLGGEVDETEEIAPNNGEIFDCDSINPSHLIRHGDLTPWELKQKVKEENDNDEDFKPEIADEHEDGEIYEEEEFDDKKSLDQSSTSKRKLKLKKSQKFLSSLSRDDGNSKLFESRILKWKSERLQNNYGKDSEEDFVEISKGLKIPSEVWERLYKYQKTGVRWLWELQNQSVGGILGDEMGLGKTIQIIAFLAALHYSKIKICRSSTLCVLIVTPATVLQQWVNELHEWWPPFRVAILHQSGSHKGKKSGLVSSIANNGGVLLTSYSTMNIEREMIIQHNWAYVILDEGHKIRNPDAQMTLAVKRVTTPHRLILTGSPMQNSLKELWSLFDFVYPGRLGTLPVFLQEFSVPITQGGYANATSVQVETAYKCACVLRDAISAYLLRRMKKDVQITIKLPDKTEQVLFCGITDHQREFYREYLNSRECDKIVSNKMDAFVGLILLRKLCNHPDLVTGGPNKLGDKTNSSDRSLNYGYYKRSGKMIVLKSLLKLWKDQNHKVLLFSQSRQLLDVVQILVKHEQYEYLRMDGSTNIASRQTLVHKFNQDPNIFVFLLTTRVGGLGVNLTGADRVLIYDPDWNPSTDMQARERAWRVGQTRPVTIYRLITTGTIEEKIYHRQIFKQLLTNRVLNDPKQKRFFKTNDLYELFTLSDDVTKKVDGDSKSIVATETSALFAGTGSEVKLEKLASKATKKKAQQSVNFFDCLARGKTVNKDVKSVDEEDVDFTAKVDGNSETQTRLRNLAKQLSSALEAQKIERTDPKKASTSKNNSVKDVRIEGVKIPFLKKHKKINREDTPDLTQMNKHQNDYVLAQLFKKSGVQSALRHDKIEKSGNSSSAVLIEKEASQVAAKAAHALLQSSKLCRKAGGVTWTGTHGTRAKHSQSNRLRFGNKSRESIGLGGEKSGVPKKKRRIESKVDKEEELRNAMFSGENVINVKREIKQQQIVQPNEDKQFEEDILPTTSSALLSLIYARNVASENSDSDEEHDLETNIRPNLPHVEETHRFNTYGDEFEELAGNIRQFVIDLNRAVSTDEIVHEFKGQVPVEHAFVFKNILSAMCEFHRARDNIGMWTLNHKFT